MLFRSMIEPTYSSSEFTTSVSATITPYPTYDELQTKIIELKSNLDSMTSNWEYQRDRAVAMSDQIRYFTEQLKSAIKDRDIDPIIAQSFAECFDISLDQEVSLTVTIEITGTATVPFGVDLDDVSWEDELQIDIHSYGEYDVDMYVDSFEVTACEEM